MIYIDLNKCVTLCPVPCKIEIEMPTITPFRDGIVWHCMHFFLSCVRLSSRLGTYRGTVACLAVHIQQYIRADQVQFYVSY